MTEKIYREKVTKLGGKIKDLSRCVDFPRTLRINSKAEALDLLDILIHDQHPSGTFTVSFDEPFKALRATIKRGLL